MKTSSFIALVLEICIFSFAAAAQPARVLTVASDGSGEFLSVQAAIDAVPSRNDQRVVIEVGPGMYHELVSVPRDKPMITLRGQNPQQTYIGYNLHARTPKGDGSGQGVGTTGSTAVELQGDDFVAENITFVNTTPRDIAQAVAVRPHGDRQIFRNCRFLGWQDTLYPRGGRQYFVDCYIEGGVDFIFGDSTAVFDQCEIRSIRSGYVTAARTPQDRPYGYVFLDCRLTRSPDVGDAEVYLGRPWRDFANVWFIRTWMDSHIKPEGWHNWGKPERESTVTYCEFDSRGPGAAPDQRVPWSTILTPEQASKVTVQSVLAGEDGWDPTHAESSTSK